MRLDQYAFLGAAERSQFYLVRLDSGVLCLALNLPATAFRVDFCVDRDHSCLRSPVYAMVGQTCIASVRNQNNGLVLPFGSNLSCALNVAVRTGSKLLDDLVVTYARWEFMFVLACLRRMYYFVSVRMAG